MLSTTNDTDLIEEQENPAGTDKMLADCFKALMMSIIGDSFMSSDAKYFIFTGMLTNLKQAGYSAEQIEAIREKMNIIIQRYNKKNDFMG